ncbi:MAG TPA: nucleotidyltransferase family protein [Dokdonella sp.]|nr:nucleotidyltransferase family protein [Dokdonella sp.]
MPDPAVPLHGVIVLAAGRSRRLGQSKQLLRIDGETLVHRSVRLALETGPADCVVVCGLHPGGVAPSVADLDCRCVACADADLGLSASLRCGLAALDAACAGALVLLTDQPYLDAAHLRALRDAWRADADGAAASGYAGTAGVPALLPRAWFKQLAMASGDSGARDLLRTRADQVRVVSAPHLERDIDFPGDLERPDSPNPA